MRVILDTNTLVRYFTRDIPEKAELVKKLLLNEKNIYIPEAVFPELAYVLQRKYMNSREEVVAVYDVLNSSAKIQLTKETRIAVSYFKNYYLDMVDCFAAAHSIKSKLASFDQKLQKITGVKPYWK